MILTPERADLDTLVRSIKAQQAADHDASASVTSLADHLARRISG